jgi:preprotein translocase subunit SecF
MQDFYKKHYKQLFFIPLIIAIPLLFIVFISPGIQQGIDLRGGNVLIIHFDKEVSAKEVESIVEAELNMDVTVSAINSPTSHGVYIEYDKDKKALDAEVLIEKARLLLADVNITSENLEGKERESIVLSVQAIKLLSGEDKNYINAKVALNDAQTLVSNFNENTSNKLKVLLTDKLNLGENAEFQHRNVSATFGEAAFGSGTTIAFWAAISLLIIIFIFFRQFVPVAGIICAMIFDVLLAMTGMVLLGIPLSLLSISALLMVVASSVDTNIMLTSKVVKEKGLTPSSRAFSALKTGLTMSATTLSALIAMIIISTLFQIDVVFQIAAILLFGLIGDLLATWLMNASLLVWFTEKMVRK